MTQESEIKFKINRNTWIIVGAFLLAAVAVLIFSYFQGTSKNSSKNSAASAQKQIQDVVAKVAKLIELPQNEQPTLATVSDVNKLKDQPFFKNAKNGDKVLIYAKNKKAIIYRPSSNKLVEVVSINVGQIQTQSKEKIPTPQTSPKQLTLTIYNGSDVSGLASTTKQKIEGKFSQVKVTATGNAAGEYSKTSVYDLTGKNKEVTSQVAQFLSGEVATASLSGETKPTTDLLVIIVQ